MNQNLYVRSKETILRKEFFGGIAFNKKKAITIELDEEGFYLLSILDKPITIKNIALKLSSTFGRIFSFKEIQSNLELLQQQGFIGNKPFSKSKGGPDNLPQLSSGSTFLSAPETVHLSITGKCNLHCAFCYGKSDTPDLSTAQIFSLIDELSSMSVFQLAIGGGEPFLRKDIFKIINYCRQKNIVVNLTTNGALLTDFTARNIKNKVGQVNLSYNEDPTGQFKRALDILLKNKINTGINLLITKDILSRLSLVIEEMLSYKIAKIIILRPKPCPNKNWYEKNRLTKSELLELKRILNKYSQGINVDCSLTCLMHDISPEELRENAVYGCVAGARFCTIRNNGDVYPCSFFSTEEFCAGNVVDSGFGIIWQKTQIFKKFREMNRYTKGGCASCRIRDYCKGCRSVILEAEQDFYSQDKECPNEDS
ncbi:MAG TPA: radical SAM protein [Candidatus Nanoarchaeia archaeon]|nr:radical SAM protein [Candidatus Nanoarchaeia archaeon]